MNEQDIRCVARTVITLQDYLLKILVKLMTSLVQIKARLKKSLLTEWFCDLSFIYSVYIVFFIILTLNRFRSV